MTPLHVLRELFALPPGASSVADEIDALHFFVIGTTLVGSVAIAAVTALMIWRFRRRGISGPSLLTPRVVATAAREAFTVVGLLSLFLLWWVIGYRQYLRMRQVPANADTVYVTAKQWMWKFTYADGRSTNDVLTVAVGRPVRLVMTSRDVIHSFYVPAFRVKQDVVPGREIVVPITPTRLGSYPLFCAEYCGVSHSNMLGEIRVLSEADYAAWRADPTSTTGPLDASLVEAGRRAALRHACFSCHTVDGQPHIGPTWSRLYGSEVTLVDGRRVIADEAYLTRSMMEPAADLVAGFKPVMPTYAGTIDAVDTAAIVELIRSLRDGPIAPTIKLPPVAPEARGEPTGEESAP